MKKKTLLTLCTAGTIVMTSAVSFAAWDKTSDTSSAITIEVAKPVTVSMKDANITFTGKLASENSLNDGASSLTSSPFTVGVSDLSTDKAKNANLKLTANGTQEGVVPTGVKVVFNDGTNDYNSGSEIPYKEGTNYTMKVSYDASSDANEAELKKLAETNLNLTVTAELIPATTN